MVDVSRDLAILSLVGNDMKRSVGVASKMFTVLAYHSVNKHINTSLLHWTQTAAQVAQPLVKHKNKTIYSQKSRVSVPTGFCQSSLKGEANRSLWRLAIISSMLSELCSTTSIASVST